MLTLLLAKPGHGGLGLLEAEAADAAEVGDAVAASGSWKVTRKTIFLLFFSSGEEQLSYCRGKG